MLYELLNFFFIDFIILFLERPIFLGDVLNFIVDWIEVPYVVIRNNLFRVAVIQIWILKPVINIVDLDILEQIWDIERLDFFLKIYV
jgi:hypothetical protein